MGVGIFAYSFFFLIMGFITFHQFVGLSLVKIGLFVKAPIYCVWDLSWVCWPLAKLCQDWMPSFSLRLSWQIALTRGSHRHGRRPCSGSFLFTFGLSGICLRLGRILPESLPLRLFMHSALHLGYEPTLCPNCCLLGELKDLSNDLDKGTRRMSSVCCPKKSTTCFRPNMTTDHSYECIILEVFEDDFKKKEI